MRFTTLMVAIFIFVTVVLGAIGTYFVNTQVSEMLKQDLADHLETAACSRADHISTYLAGSADSLALISSRTKLRIALRDYNQLKRPEDLEWVNNILSDAKDPIDDFESISVIGLNGTVIASTNKIMAGKDYSDNIIFTKGKDTNDIYHMPRSRDGAYLLLTGPIILDNESLGVMFIRLKGIEKLYSITLDRTGLGETGEIYLVDTADGCAITPLRFVETGLPCNLNASNVQACLAHKTLSSQKIRSVHENIQVYKDYRGIEVVGTHVYLPEKEWCLLAEIDKTEAIDRPLGRIRNISLYTVLILVTAAAFIGLVVAGQMSKPIKMLKKDLDKISKGKIDIQLGKSSITELQSLIDSLNRILASLKLAVQKVGIAKSEIGLGEALKAKEKAEKEVKERTEELERFAKLAVGREMKMIELKKRIKELRKEEGVKGKEIPEKSEKRRTMEKKLEKKLMKRMKEESQKKTPEKGKKKSEKNKKTGKSKKNKSKKNKKTKKSK